MTHFDFEIKSRQFFDSFLVFYSGWNKGQISRVEIKKRHSERVAELSGLIAASLHLDREEVALARSIGLLHDIGRFPQLIKYNTFDDSVSEDHSKMALEELERVGLLQGLTPETAAIVHGAIYHHNKEEIPSELTAEEQLFCRIVRDADKLDILQSLTDYYANPSDPADHTLSWKIQGGRGISESVVTAAKSGKTVRKEYVRTGDDVKVMQLSWVYDLNFKASFRILASEQYVDKIYRALPKRDDVFDIYRVARIYLENKFLN
ncbi:MAG: HD domain-containing protein [Prolixibacteraceae bacterium]|nr:HD domain-containing protein [Prolixibacteraceae bacterium]HOY51911.1 HD domain-containing protein [Prolixibacteraceae bacterium]